MKNTIKWFGIIALAVIIGFSAAACNKQGNTLDGTWVGPDGEAFIILNDDISISQNDVLMMKGKYVLEDDNITMSFTHLNGNVYGDAIEVMGIEAGEWYTISELKDGMIKFLMESIEVSEAEAEDIINAQYDDNNEVFEVLTGTFLLNDDKLTLNVFGDSTVYTRK